MKITTLTGHAEITRTFTIADGPVVPMAYASPPKLVRIERGSIKYTWTDDGWIVEGPWDIELSGPVLKKDGATSKNNHTRRPEENWSAVVPGECYIPAEGWEWVQEIVNQLRPTGNAHLPEA